MQVQYQKFLLQRVCMRLRKLLRMRVDMADAIMAQRAYEANLALVNISKSMAAKAVEIGR